MINATYMAISYNRAILYVITYIIYRFTSNYQQRHKIKENVYKRVAYFRLVNAQVIKAWRF